MRDHKKFEVKIDPSGGEFTMTENNFGGPAAHFRLLIMVYAELCSNEVRCAVLGSDSSSFFRHLDVVVLNEFFGLSLLFALTLC